MGWKQYSSSLDYVISQQFTLDNARYNDQKSQLFCQKKNEKGNQPKHLMIRADQLWIDIMLFCKSFRREIRYMAI